MAVGWASLIIFRPLSASVYEDHGIATGLDFGFDSSQTLDVGKQANANGPCQ
jgi:hypothetical protein